MKFTAICLDGTRGYPDPLIVEIEGKKNMTEDEVFELVLLERVADLGDEYADEIRACLRVCFLIAGQINLAQDWRI